MTDSSTPAPMAETPDAERLLNEDEPAGPGSVVDRLRTRAEAFETRPAMHDGFTYTADDAKLDRDAIAALRAPASPPVQDAGEAWTPSEPIELPPATDRGLAGQIMDAAWAEFGGSHQSGEFWWAFSDAVRFAIHVLPGPAEIERLTAERDEAWRDGHERVGYLSQRLLDTEARATKAEADLAEARAALVDPDMPAQQLRLHMGELTASEARVARAAIRWANTHLTPEKADV